MQRKLSILFFLCCFSAGFYNCYSQTFYANTGDAIKKITVTNSGCNVSSISFPCALDFFSIAISGDTLYFYTAAKSALYRTFLSKPYVCEEVLQMPLVNALTVGKDGIIYAAQDIHYLK